VVLATSAGGPARSLRGGVFFSLATRWRKGCVSTPVDCDGLGWSRREGRSAACSRAGIGFGVSASFASALFWRVRAMEDQRLAVHQRSLLDPMYSLLLVVAAVLAELHTKDARVS
jgi:hypothetical protein